VVVAVHVQITILPHLMEVVEAAVAVEDKIKMAGQELLVKVVLVAMEVLADLVMEVVVVAVQAL
jgi:hypothetical protein